MLTPLHLKKKWAGEGLLLPSPHHRIPPHRIHHKLHHRLHPLRQIPPGGIDQRDRQPGRREVRHQADQAARRDVGAGEDVGEDGEAPAGQGGAVDGDGAVGRQPRGDAKARLVGAVGEGPQAPVAGAGVADAVMAGHLLRPRRRGALGEIAGCGHQEGRGPADAPAGQAGILDGAEPHFEIDALADEIGGRLAQQEIDAEAGMAGEQLRQALGEGEAERGGQGKPHLAGDGSLAGARALAQRLHRLDHAQGHRDQPLALGRQRQGHGGAVEQAHPEPRLQRRDLARHRRLGEIEIGSRRSEGARLRHAQEGPQGAHNVHSPAPILLRIGLMPGA